MFSLSLTASPSTAQEEPQATAIDSMRERGRIEWLIRYASHAHEIVILMTARVIRNKKYFWRKQWIDAFFLEVGWDLPLLRPC